MSGKSKESSAAQSERFIEAARQAECSEDEAVFDRVLKKIVKARPPAKKSKKAKLG